MSLLVSLLVMVCVQHLQSSVVVCWHPKSLLEQVRNDKKRGGGVEGHVLFIYGILNICVLVTFAGAILFLIFGVFYSVNAYNGLQE